MDQFVKEVYRCTKEFPKDEIYGIISQFRRASLSVILNYIEGYARQRKQVLRNFIEISYGSLRESRYLTELSHSLDYLSKEDSQKLFAISDRIGAMLWGILKKLK